jgi:hemerythrin-like domain-containing protein
VQVSGYVSQALDSEHRASIELLGRIEQALARPSSAAGDDFARLAGAFVRLIEHDIGRHFDFEENELFPRMADAGEVDIAGLLREEHDAIREVAAEVLPLARAAAGGTLDRAGFDELRRGASELIERQVAHIQKETMALLPLLDDLLDDDLDRGLALRYSEG